jgi:outer membrane protein assembly factor BamB
MRGSAFALAIVLLATGCGDKDKRWKSKKARLLAQQQALEAAKNSGPARRPKLHVSAEQFAQMMAAPFGEAETALADPEGRFYRSPEHVWERDLRFDAGNAAFDKARTTLYGADRSGRGLATLELRTGQLRPRAGGLFRPIPRKVDPKKIIKADLQQPTEPVFELTGDMLIVAQNVSTLHELKVKIFGLSASTGRLVWQKQVPHPWQDTFALWSEGPVAFLGDSSAGPIFVFDTKTGKQSKIEYPKDETYVFGGSDGKRTIFYHWRPPNELYLVGHDANGAVVWRRQLPDCYPNKAYFAPFVNGGVLPCKAKSSPKEHVDKVMKISLADGKTLWETEVLKRPGDSITDPKRPDLISLRKGKDGASYFRNRFGFARVEPDGRFAWSYPLDDKEIYVLIGDEPFRSENVMGGDKPYELIVSLDRATGKPLWEYKEEDGLPARGLVRDGNLLLWGETEIRVLSLATGKVVLTHKTPQRLEGIALVAGVLYIETAGVRRAIRLADQQLLLYDKSEDETILNNWIDTSGLAGLFLYHDERRRVAFVEPVKEDRRIPLPKERVRKVRLLTPPNIEIDGLRWVDDNVLELTSADDNRVWRLGVTGGKPPTSVGTRREGGPRHARAGVAFLGDPTKVTEKASLKLVADGKTTTVSERPAGDFAWSQSGTQLVYAERRDTSVKASNLKIADFVVRVFDARRGRGRDILLIRGADEMARLNSASFAPGDHSVTLVIENLYGNHYVGTLSTAGKVTGQMKVNDNEGTITIRLPNSAPTQRLGVDSGDTFGDVAWSPGGRHLAVLRGPKLQILDGGGRELLPRPESAVSILRWAPRGGALYYVKDGNLWRWRRGKTEQVSFFLAKREPRIEEEVRVGNLPRFAELKVSPDGKRLAFGLRFPDSGAAMRAAVLDLE